MKINKFLLVGTTALSMMAAVCASITPERAMRQSDRAAMGDKS